MRSQGNTALNDAVYLLQLRQPGGQLEVKRGRRVTLWRRAGGKWTIQADVWFNEAAGAHQTPARLTQAPAPQPVEARLAQLESTVGQLTHFIGASLRPALGAAALPGAAPAQKPPKEVKENKDFE